MTETFTVNTKEICPIMANVVNLFMYENMEIDDMQTAIAVAALGVMLLQGHGIDPADQDMIEALEMLSEAFSNSLVKKYGGPDE